MAFSGIAVPTETFFQAARDQYATLSSYDDKQAFCFALGCIQARAHGLASISSDMVRDTLLDVKIWPQGSRIFVLQNLTRLIASTFEATAA